MNNCKLPIFLALSGVFAMGALGSCSKQNADRTPPFRALSPDEERVIVHKETERPFTGKYLKFDEKGTYVCKRCGAPLYRAEDKFDAHCGWPSFDDEISGAVKRLPDADGERTEIVCANCRAHLGHVFTGEGLTPKDTRHCVNSISMEFVPAAASTTAAPAARVKSARAIFAGGCFWGVEYHFQHASGVLSTRVGYTGGHKPNPTYEEVCSGETGHAEALEITFDPTKTSFEELARLFFEIHDPTQVDRQGPDMGAQYRSAIFYLDEEQRQTAEKLIQILRNRGYAVATKLLAATEFWPAEGYHQRYYEHKGTQPYCHVYTKRFSGRSDLELRSR